MSYQPLQPPAEIDQNVSRYIFEELSRIADDLALRTPHEIIRKESDETVNNSSTLQNDDDLIVRLDEKEVIYFDCVVYYSSNATADFKYGFTVPSGATLKWAEVNTEINNSAVVNSSGSTVIVPGSGTDEMTLSRGIVVNGGTQGVLRLQWAQNTADVSNTIVRANSHIRVARV